MRAWSGLHFFEERLKAVELFTVYRATSKSLFLATICLYFQIVHLDEEATEDAALVRVMREEEEQAVADNGKGTKEPW